MVDVAKVEMYALGWFAAGREPDLDTLVDIVTSLTGVRRAEIWAGPIDARTPKGLAHAGSDETDEADEADEADRDTTAIVSLLDPDATGTSIGGVEAIVGPDADVVEVRRVVEHLATHVAALIGRWRTRDRNRGIAVVDADATLLWANEELSRVMGWSVTETVGTNVLDYLHPDDLGPAAESFDRTARFPGPKVPYDLRFRTPEGAWLALETIAENRLDDPAVGGIMFWFRDPRNRPPEDRLVSTETEVLTAIAGDLAWSKVFDLVVGMLDDRLPAATWSVWAPADPGSPAADGEDRRDATGDGEGDGRGGALARIATSGDEWDLDGRAAVAIAPSGTAVGACFHRLQTVVVSDIERDDLLDDDERAGHLQRGVRAVWAVPVLRADGTASAVLEGHAPDVGPPSADQSRVLDLAANLLALALERARAREANEHAASHDAMTGLPNRQAFTALLASRIDQTPAGHLTVLFIDLDAFKTINDSLGHAAGDTLLRAVADRVQASCEAHADLIGLARFGGDEFMLLVQEPESAAELADGILDALAAPFEIDGYDLHMSASVGMAVHDAELSPTASDLLSNADAAMYVAKRTAPRRTVAFDREIASLVSERLTTTTGLRRAVEAEEFVVHYQSIVDLTTTLPVAAEALVRWHEGDVVHPPAVFLEVAEETGLIVPIGRLVLGHAARRTARHGQITFVNLSAHQLLDDGLAGLIEVALDQAGVAAAQIGFEITEHAVIPDPDAAIEVLLRLREHGHPLSIDDFGTGYASLAYLRDLPVDSVKIDRSFTARVHDDERTRTILRATVELAHDLHLTVVAEGIETARDAALMAELGCDHGQGWYFHRPAPDA